MRSVRTRLEFRVELGGDHTGMVAKLHDLHKLPVRRSPGDDKPLVFKNFSVGIIKFVSMPMTLENL